LKQVQKDMQKNAGVVKYTLKASSILHRID